MPHVLYIEDNETLAELIKLRYSHINIETVRTMGEARNLLGRGGYDVLLVDLKLPDSESVDTVESLLPYGIPMVVITAYPTREFVKAASRLGVTDYITKSNLDKIDLGLRLQFAHDRNVYNQRAEPSSKPPFTFAGMEECKRYISCASSLSRPPW